MFQAECLGVSDVSIRVLWSEDLGGGVAVYVQGLGTVTDSQMETEFRADSAGLKLRYGVGAFIGGSVGALQKASREFFQNQLSLLLSSCIVTLMLTLAVCRPQILSGPCTLLNLQRQTRSHTEASLGPLGLSEASRVFEAALNPEPLNP